MNRVTVMPKMRKELNWSQSDAFCNIVEAHEFKKPAENDAYLWITPFVVLHFYTIMNVMYV